MKKLLSLLLIMAMLSSVSAFAVTEVEYTFKGEDGYVYHFGTFGAEDEDAGLIINGKKYSLTGGTHSCTDENCENAFTHAQNNNQKFGMGIKLDNGEDSYTMAPYATVAGDDDIAGTETVNVAIVEAFPETEVDNGTYDHVTFTVAEMARTDSKGVRTVATGNMQAITSTYTEDITFNFSGALEGVTTGEKVILTIYVYARDECPNSSFNVYGGAVTNGVLEYDSSNVIASLTDVAVQNGGSSAVAALIPLQFDVTDYIKTLKGKTSATLVLQRTGSTGQNVNIICHTHSKESYKPYWPSLNYVTE